MLHRKTTVYTFTDAELIAYAISKVNEILEVPYEEAVESSHRWENDRLTLTVVTESTD